MGRFPAGKGTLYDLEFLEDPTTGVRVAAFGMIRYVESKDNTDLAKVIMQALPELLWRLWTLDGN